MAKNRVNVGSELDARVLWAWGGVGGGNWKQVNHSQIGRETAAINFR